jgi:uncharacterized sporulation protein YeaH/YhbH (DUF444 family)
VEVGVDTSAFSQRESEVWKMYAALEMLFPQIAARKLTSQTKVIEVFRSLFKQKAAAA